jgi:hypothetical protein
MSDSILLYHFMPANHALSAIQKRRFKVGQVRDFNDPFEWRLSITGYIPGGEAVVDAAVESLVDHVHSSYGIICFSASAAEPVLWGHYGDKHRGVAFEVDYLIEPDKLFKMSYSDCRPMVDGTRLHKPDVEAYLLPILKQMIFQKSAGWEYEKEYRAYRRLDECQKEDGKYFERIPDDFLTRVILGFQCPLKEEEVRTALDAVGLTDTKVVRAQMDRHTYAITWERVEEAKLPDAPPAPGL